MKELVQAGNYYKGLNDEQKKDLAESIATDIFFLEDELQLKVIDIFAKVDIELSEEIKQRNSFTT